jgi:hypothetical protein
MGRGDAVDPITAIIGRHTLTTMGGTTNPRDGDMPRSITVGTKGIGTHNRQDGEITDTMGIGISPR